MSLDILKDALSGMVKALGAEIEDEYREEAEEFLKQAVEDLGALAWDLSTAKTTAEADQARALMADVQLSAELLASELYLHVADAVDDKVVALRDRLKSYVRAIASTLKVIGPLLA